MSGFTQHRPRGPVARHATRGQSITELALIGPVLAIILLGLIEISGAYGAKMDLQSLSFHAARIGALGGNGGQTVFTCPNTSASITDTVDMSIVQSIISGTRELSQSNIAKIQVFKAGVNGTIALSGTKPLVNEYKPPFISGSTLITNTYNWPSCMRSSNEPADSLGVHIMYNYHPTTPLFGRATLLMNDSAIQRLNPSKNDSPCPVPGAPTDLVAHYHVDTSHPQPVSTDDITWTAVDNATSYKIYAGVNGVGVGTTPVYTYTAAPTNGPVTWSYPYSPAGSQVSYQVRGANYCGDGDISDPVPNGQFAYSITPTIITATTSITMPGSDYLSWTAVPDAQTYKITQTPSTGAPVSTTVVTAPITSVVIPDPYYSPAVANVTYQVAATSLSNVAGPAASAIITSSAAPTTTIDDAISSTTSLPSTFVFGTLTASGSNNWVHCSTTSTPSCFTLGVQATSLYSNTVSYSNQANDTADIKLGSSVSQVWIYGATQKIGGLAYVWIDDSAAATSPPSSTNATWYSPSAMSQQLIKQLTTTISGIKYLHIKVAGVKDSSCIDSISPTGCGYFAAIDAIVVQ